MPNHCILLEGFSSFFFLGNIFLLVLLSQSLLTEGQMMCEYVINQTAHCYNFWQPPFIKIPCKVRDIHALGKSGDGAALTTCWALTLTVKSAPRGPAILKISLSESFWKSRVVFSSWCWPDKSSNSSPLTPWRVLLSTSAEGKAGSCSITGKIIN